MQPHPYQSSVPVLSATCKYEMREYVCVRVWGSACVHLTLNRERRTACAHRCGKDINAFT
uniref:SFRICE_011183 n=1 Tax=Spodoptera frugiperda TaxID=7108 RepID=A0A2H1X132_SPOFR